MELIDKATDTLFYNRCFLQNDSSTNENIHKGPSRNGGTLRHIQLRHFRHRHTFSGAM